MSALEASSAGVRDMADGSLRITFEFEPRFAADAFALFGSRGTAVAVAALKPRPAWERQPGGPSIGNPGVTADGPQQAAPQAEERPKGGELAKWAAIRCGEQEFQRWMAGAFPDTWRASHGETPADRAAVTVRRICGVASRAELDSNADARRVFDLRIRNPYSKHCIATGATA